VTKYCSILLLLAFSLAGCRSGPHREEGEVSFPPGTEDRGWQQLFDGRTLNGWQALGLDSIPTVYWRVEDGTIHKRARDRVAPLPDGSPPPSCDLMSRDTFLNFELAFEWKIAPLGNSGIKYNVSEKMSLRYGTTHALGFEYQIIDDAHYSEPLSPMQHTAALYALVAPENAEPRPAGRWNTGRIILRGHHGEHWLNGKKVLEYETGTPRFDSLVRHSKYHKYPGFARRRYGHIVLQDHADDVWFRNIRIRTFDKP